MSSSVSTTESISIHELSLTMPEMHDLAPVEPVIRQVAGYTGVSVPTTDRKVRGSNPFGHTSDSLALTSTNGQGQISFGNVEWISGHRCRAASSWRRRRCERYRSTGSRLQRITSDPAVCHGQPTVRGLRYPVENLLELLSSGTTIDPGA